MGNKIVEGIMSTQLKKLEKYVKNFKHVASFSFVNKIKDKIEIGFCKIPFPREDDLKEFEKNYNNVMDLLREDEDKNQETSNESKKKESISETKKDENETKEKQVESPKKGNGASLVSPVKNSKSDKK